MKRKSLLVFSSVSLLLLACGTPATPISSSPTASSVDSSKEESSSIPASSSEQSSSSSESSSSSASSSQSVVPSTDGIYNFYCINDFHGSIVEQMNGNAYEAGIAKLFGRLKKLKSADPEHNIILSAGDMYQGSLESNSNLGELVTKAMNNAGFDAMAVGNHEFDYGLEPLLNNISKANFPVLGGNIVKHDTDIAWNDVVKSSTVLEKGGNKIGIVGMIGYGQTTSITSPIVKDIDFKNPNNLALTEAARLREREGCNIVIYLLHDAASTCAERIHSKTYFDGVFNGHTHKKEKDLVYGVPFVQGGCNGQGISHFQLTIKDGSVTCTNYAIIDSDSSWKEDEEIATIRDSYIEEPSFKAKASAVAGTVTGTLYSDEGVPNVAVKAMYEKYKALHPELVCAIENGQRASLSGEITYHDIYKATPFMNKIVIGKVLGREIENEAKYGAACYRGDNGQFESNKYYTVACIDYVLYHQNEAKYYNYFSSLNTNFESKIVAEYVDYPFDITFDYIKNTLNGQVNASDFLNSSPGFGQVS